MSDFVSTIRCLICFDSLSADGTKRAVSLLCGHVFCYECAERVANTDGRCGFCRQYINAADIRLLFVDINPEYQESITLSLQNENDQLRSDAESLHRICVNLNAVNSCQLISTLVAVEDHPFFLRRPATRLGRQLCDGLKEKFDGFRIASGLS